MKTGEPVESLSLSKILVLYMRKYQITSYFLIVDYTRRIPVVHKVLSMTGQHVSSQYKLIFSEYGWPGTLVSDNGPCYTTETFTSMIKEYGVNHITSSPYYS